MVILFDLDGTLIDSTEAILEGFKEAFLAHGDRPVCNERVEALVGHPLDVMFDRLGVPKQRVDSYVEAYKSHYRTIHREKTVLLPRAKEAIALAASIARLGIVTTKTALYSQELMEHFGVMGHFEVLVGREHVTHPKPHPEPVLKACEAMGIGAEESVVLVGDTPMDAQAAKAAGVKSMGVTCGYGETKELESYCDWVCDDSYEAVELLQRLTKI